MMIFSLIIIAIISYLLGSVNGAIIASHLIFHDDVREHGSHNAGLTNFHRNYGTKGLAVVIAIDIGKAAIALLIGRLIFGLFDQPLVGMYFAALCLILGHMFPVFYQFRGGKGILSGALCLLMIDWRIGLVSILLFVVIVAATRYVSLGSIAGAAYFPLGTLLCGHGGLCATLALVIAVLVIAKHWQNIVRLIRHEESKLVFKKDVSEKFDENF